MEFDTMEEMEFVVDLTVKEGMPDTQWWVGLERNSSSCKFRWITSQDGVRDEIPSGFSCKPNEECVRLNVMNDTGYGYLADLVCNQYRRGICEKRSASDFYFRLVSSASSPVSMRQELELQNQSIIQCAVVCAVTRLCVGFEHDTQDMTCHILVYDVTGVYDVNGGDIPTRDFYQMEMCA